jgi:hypothetical protein
MYYAKHINANLPDYCDPTFAWSRKFDETLAEAVASGDMVEVLHIETVRVGGCMDEPSDRTYCDVLATVLPSGYLEEKLISKHKAMDDFYYNDDQVPAHRGARLVAIIESDPASFDEIAYVHIEGQDPDSAICLGGGTGERCLAYILSHATQHDAVIVNHEDLV